MIVRITILTLICHEWQGQTFSSGPDGDLLLLELIQVWSLGWLRTGAPF